MSKGSNSSTTTTAPNPAAMQAYNDLLQRAGQVSQTPYQGYGGEQVAPVNAQQTIGIGNVNANAGFANPFVLQGQENIAGGAAPINASDIASHYDPYNQKVIDATMADFDTQNKRANSIVTGNAAAQGALGGNRVGVAQALTQEAQNRTQAPVIAGLQSRGFENAQQAAMADKSRGIAGGSAQIQGGVAGQTAGLQGAGAQIGAGTLQQTTQQAQDTQNRLDYYQAQGYPFQTAQWLAGITTGVGSQMGGTSETQGPEPNQWAQAAGIGLSAAAMFSDRRMKENVEEVGKLNDGQKIYRFNYKGNPKTQIGLISQEVEKEHPDAVRKVGGFGTVDYEAATADAVNKWRGGSIRSFAQGGAPAAGPWSEGQGWVPTIGLTGGKGAPPPPNLPGSQNSPLGKDSGAGLGALGKKFSGMFDSQGSNGLSTDAPDNGSGIYTGDASIPGFAGSSGSSGFDTYWARGGGVRPGFALGGVPISAGFGGGSFEDRFSASPDDPDYSNPEIVARSNSMKNVDGYDSPLRKEALNSDVVWRNPDIADVPLPRPKPMGVAEQAEPIFRSAGVGADDDGGDAMAFAPGSRRGFDGVPRGIIPPGVAASPESSPEKSSGLLGNPFNLSDEARQGLISMGLGMMANRRGGKGSFLASVGEGGEQGMTTYASAKSATALRALEQRKEALERDKFSETKAQHERTLEEQKRHRQFLEMQPVKIGMDKNYNEVWAIKDPKSGKFVPIDPQTGAPRTDNPNVIPQEPGAKVSSADAELPAGASPVSYVGTLNDRPAGQYFPDVLEGETPEMRNTVKAIAEGRRAMPALGRNNPYNRKISELVQLYNPSWDQSTFPARQRTVNEFNVGVAAKNLTATKTLAGHLQSLYDAAKVLDNSRYPIVNAVQQGIGTQTALYGKAYQDAIADYETKRKAVADEAAKVFAGSTSALADREEWMKMYSPTAPMNVQVQKIRSTVDLVDSRLNAIADQYNRGMSTNRQAYDLIEPKYKAIFDRMRHADPEKEKAAASGPPPGSVAGTKDGAKVWKTPDGKYIARDQ